MPDSAIEVLKKWVENGAKKGEPWFVFLRDNRKVRVDTNQGSAIVNTKRTFRKPDLILKMPKPILLAGDNKQHFYCYKIPFEILKERPVRAIEYVPGNRKMVHHASYQIVETSAKAPIFKEPYFFEYNTEVASVDDSRDFKFLNLTDSTENFQPQLRFHTGWLPGTGLHEYPKGIGFTMPKRGVLLIRNLHYSATPVPESDQSEIHIYFADQPVTRVLEFAAFKPRKVTNIIPKDTVVTYGLTIRIGSDMSLLNINPHMHKLGKYFKAYVVTPAKDTIKLVEILDWDFNWQEFYRFRHPIKIPKGSVLNAEARYDNTARNMNNPNRPPIDIAFERGNMDDDREEMMRLVFVYLPYNEGDEIIKMENLVK